MKNLADVQHPPGIGGGGGGAQGSQKKISTLIYLLVKIHPIKQLVSVMRTQWPQLPGKNTLVISNY